MEAAAPAPPCVLDIEASGFGGRSYPIEVGYVMPDGRARCTLVRPARHWVHWDETAQQVHGIEREMLIRHGRAPLEVARMMNADLAGRVVYCDGWAHDYAWLGVLFEEADLVPAFRLETAARLLDGDALDRLDGERRRVRDELGLVRHRASSDARVLQLALQRLATPQPRRAAAGPAT